MPDSFVSIPPNPIVDITPPLLNGWVVASTYSFKVYREGRRVWCEGLLDGTAATAGTMFTLPAGSRPASKLGFGGGWFRLVDVFPNGDVGANTTGSQVYVTGITFGV